MAEAATATAEEHNATGNEHFKAGEYEEAFKSYTLALKRHTPTSNPDVAAKYFTNRAACCINSENWELACKDAEAAIELQPRSAKGHLYKGIALEHRSMFGPALQAYEKLLDLDPAHKQAQQGVMRCRASRARDPTSNKAAASFVSNQARQQLEKLLAGTSSSPSPAQLESLLQGSLGSLVQAGGPVGKVLLAHMHRDGLEGKPKDPALAAKLYAEAGEAGSAEGMFMAGQMLLRGPAQLQDVKRGRRWLERAAAQRPFLMPGVKNLGVLEAHHALGSMFRDGLGLPAPDIPNAVHWYKKTAATAGGHALAENDLGCLYHSGAVTGSPDAAAAAEWYRKAADHGFAIAQYNLACLYREGEGVKCDQVKAKEYLQRAAAQGYAPAECALVVTETDVGAALQRLRSAAEGGEPEACYLLGRAHLKAELGLAADAAQAKRWLRRAAKQGLAPAQFELGQLYWRGADGCDTKPDKGFALMEQAAQQQLPCAEYLLHCMYRTGSGTKQDLPRARMWLERAVEHGYASGRAELQDWSSVARASLAGQAGKKAWEKSEAAAVAAGGRAGLGACSREEVLRAATQQMVDAAPDEAQRQAMREMLQLAEGLLQRQDVTPASPAAQRETYPLEALLRHADDESVPPLIQAKLQGFAALAAAARGDARAAVSLLSEAYDAAEYVVALPMPEGWDDMVRCCTQLLRRDPNDAQARFCLLRLRITVGQHGPAWAVQELDAVIGLQPADHTAWSFRGCMKAFLHEYPGSVKDFAQAIQLAGGPGACPPEYLYLRGVSRVNVIAGRAGDPGLPAAREDFETFLARAPPRHRKVPNACYFLAFLHTSVPRGRPQAQAGGRGSAAAAADAAASRAWYARGLEAEREQLPFHPPVDSPYKDLLRLQEQVLSLDASRGREMPGGGSVAGGSGDGDGGRGGGQCAGCGKACLFGLKLKLCSRCKQTAYCSKECQQADWKSHKKACTAQQ